MLPALLSQIRRRQTLGVRDSGGQSSHQEHHPQPRHLLSAQRDHDRPKVRHDLDAEQPAIVGRPNVPIQVPSFDLECDADDIDLLIARLSEAKQLVNSACEAMLTEEE